MSIVAWYVSNYDSAPIRKEFARETSAFYIALNKRGEERREKKESTWWRYFTDEQEALDFIAARDAAKEKRAQESRVKAAAPELLEALEDALPLMGWSNMSDAEIQHEADEGNGTAPVIQKMRAAIAKARGDA